MSQLNVDLNTLRHSTAHVLAQAVLKKFPNASLGIGPAIEDGFYYDFDLTDSITESDLTELEDIMQEIINEKQQFRYFSLDRAATLDKLNETNQQYKLELVNDLDLDEYSFYENGPFIDLCKGPHMSILDA